MSCILLTTIAHFDPNETNIPIRWAIGEQCHYAEDLRILDKVDLQGTCNCSKHPSIDHKRSTFIDTASIPTKTDWYSYVHLQVTVQLSNSLKTPSMSMWHTKPSHWTWGTNASTASGYKDLISLPNILMWDLLVQAGVNSFLDVARQTYKEANTDAAELVTKLSGDIHLTYPLLISYWLRDRIS